MSNNSSDTGRTFEKFPLTRENKAGMIMLSCDKLPGFLLTATSEKEVRSVIDAGLKFALDDRGSKVQVYTNGSIAGPVIGTVVEIDE
ncbi:MAG: hypothetical protein AAGD04_12075 [Pseudomonadota bacterium]